MYSITEGQLTSYFHLELFIVRMVWIESSSWLLMVEAIQVFSWLGRFYFYARRRLYRFLSAASVCMSDITACLAHIAYRSIYFCWKATLLTCLGLLLLFS